MSSPSGSPPPTQLQQHWQKLNGLGHFTAQCEVKSADVYRAPWVKIITQRHNVIPISWFPWKARTGRGLSALLRALAVGIGKNKFMERSDPAFQLLSAGGKDFSLSLLFGKRIT